MYIMLTYTSGALDHVSKKDIECNLESTEISSADREEWCFTQTTYHKIRGLC